MSKKDQLAALERKKRIHTVNSDALRQQAAAADAEPTTTTAEKQA